MGSSDIHLQELPKLEMISSTIFCVPAFQYHDEFNQFQAVAMQILDQSTGRQDFVQRNAQLLRRNLASTLFDNSQI